MNSDAPRHDPADVLATFLAEMAATNELLAGANHLTSVLRIIARRAQALTDADYAAISTFDEDGVLERFVYEGIDPGLARRLGDPPVGRGLLGALAHAEHPIRLADLQQHPQFTGWPEGHPDMTVFLGVPLRSGGKVIGSLYLTRVRGRAPFSEWDELSAVTLALQAAASVAITLSQEQNSRVNLLEERQRIAHDLHDGTIQTLYAIGLGHSAFIGRDDLPEEVRKQLADETGLINALISDIRQYIEVLEDAMQPGPPDLARDLARIIRMAVSNEIETVLNLTAASLQEITSRDAEDLLYIAREALSNAVRHGAPTKIAVDLRESQDGLSLTIQDNGTGFNQAAARTGLGTVTMRTRAQRLGGVLSIVAIPGMGTTVRVTIQRGNEA